MSRESRKPPAKGKKTAKSDPSTRGRAGRGAGKTGPASKGTGRTRQRARPALTGRAAILALVVCVIALSLAYPLREYVMQRAQLAQLQEEREHMEDSVQELEQRSSELSQEEYVEREARTRLHYQYPDEVAYIVVRPDADIDADAEGEPAEPWFSQLWRSVEEADDPRPHAD